MQQVNFALNHFLANLGANKTLRFFTVDNFKAESIGAQYLSGNSVEKIAQVSKLCIIPFAQIFHRSKIGLS